MILTCPECATGYFVDDAKIGPGGRTVRCRSCGAQWRASGDTLDLHPEPNEFNGIPVMAGGATVADLSAEPRAQDLPKVYRARVQSDRQMRKAAVQGVLWAGIAAVFLGLIGGAVIFRVDMVRLWPRTAAAYAAIGLPVNPVGLAIEQVRAEPSLQDGHAALMISGVIRNVEDRPVTAPPIRITLLNAEGREVGAKLAVPTNARIPPGGTRHFTVAVLDPPGSTANLMIAFDRNASPEDIRQALRDVSRAAGHGETPRLPNLRGPSAPADTNAAAPADPHAAAPAVGSDVTPGVPLQATITTSSGSGDETPAAVTRQPATPRPATPAQARTPAPAAPVSHGTTTVTSGGPVARPAARATTASPPPAAVLTPAPGMPSATPQTAIPPAPAPAAGTPLAAH